MSNRIRQNREGSAQQTSKKERQISVALLVQKHDDELISRQETAAWLSVCPHTVQRNRALKPIRINARLVRYRVGDVRALIEAAHTK